MVVTQQTAADGGTVARARRVLALVVGVRVPMQHGVMALALLGGAVLGVLLAGQLQSGPAELLPPWMPAGVWTSALVSGALGALLAGLSAWLVCRPKRAQQWTIEYPRRRTISLHGLN